MSHATGFVLVEKGADLELVGYYDYNGTIDVAHSKIVKTRDELMQIWRADNEQCCTCGKTPVRVVLRTNYGYGYEWDGEACLDCMAITAGRDPYDDAVNQRDWDYEKEAHDNGAE